MTVYCSTNNTDIDAIQSPVYLLQSVYPPPPHTHTHTHTRSQPLTDPTGLYPVFPVEVGKDECVATLKTIALTTVSNQQFIGEQNSNKK